MLVDLKNLRERKGLTREEMVTTLNLFWQQEHPDEKPKFTQDRLLRLEKEPEKISLEELALIIRVFGVTFDQLLQPKIGRLSAPEVQDNWNYIQDLVAGFDQELAKAPDFVREQYGQELHRLRNSIARKGRIAFVGRPDSGKSRTINTLLGEDILPVGWTPVTSAFIMIKSIHDRPEYMDFHTVYVASEGDEEQWNPDNFADKDYCAEWQLDMGGYDLIKEYGTHGGSAESKNAGAIVVYVDSPFLENCDLLDLPGFGQGVDDKDDVQIDDIYNSRDTVLSQRASRLADAFVYLSIANSFLYGDDLAMVQAMVKILPTLENKNKNKLEPFGNLFLVASQAMTVNRGDKVELEKICDKAAERLWKLLDLHPAMAEKLVDSDGCDYTEKALRKRFFTSEMDSEDLTRDFYKELAAFASMMPQLLLGQATEKISEYFVVLSKMYEGRIEDKKRKLCETEKELCDKREQLFDCLEKREESIQRIQVVRKKIEKEMQETRKNCEDIYDKVLNAGHVTEVLEENNYGKNKKDLLDLVTILTEELEKCLTESIGKNSKSILQELDEILDEMSPAGGREIFYRGVANQENAGALVNLSSSENDTSTADYHFWKGIVGAAGMALVFSIVHVMSMALASVLGYGGTWRQLIGNRFVKEFESKKVLDKLAEHSEKYWEDTLTALDAGVAEMEEELDRSQVTKKELCEEYAKDKEALEYFSNFGSRFWLWHAGDGWGIKIG